MNDLNKDPRLTAYVLGELSPHETKEIEMLLEKNKDTKEEVENIKSAVNIVTSDLKEDQKLAFNAEELEKIEKLTNQDKSLLSTWSQKFLYWGGPAIAVCLLVVLNIKQENMNPISQGVFEKANDKVLSRADSDEDSRVDENAEGDNLTSPKLKAVSGKVAKDKNIKAKELNALTDSISPMTTEKTNRQAPAKREKKIARSSSKFRSDYKGGSGGLVGGITGNDQGLGRKKFGKASTAAPNAMMLNREAEEGYIANKPADNESYDAITNDAFSYTKNKPLSTFSIDVDTASYSNMRRFLNNGNIPPVNSVRIEEFVNYFNYDYKHSGKHPISIHMEQSFSPWNKKNRLVKVAMKAKPIAIGERPSSNFVFLLDVSGSMGNANKLPLLKNAMKLLTRKLTEKDKIAIVVYAGASGIVLPATNGLEKAKILKSLTRLNAGGGTNGEAGILSAYKIAKENFIKGGNNRIILATDGDFNVGTTNRNSLVELVAKKAKDNIFLTVLGLGMGNYKDGMLEKLADKGNGNYAYLDTLNEAKKVLITDMDKTLHTVAKDVKIQVEFNPKLVSAYRLIGYENRKLAAKDFNDDKKDAGEVGAGHNITAFYEIVPHGVAIADGTIDQLKYQKTKDQQTKPAEFTGEFMNVKVRYKTPTGTKSTKFEKPLIAKDVSFKDTSKDFRFATAVASFGMVLRKDSRVGTMNIFNILQTAKGAKGKDLHGYRQEFIENVELARDIYKTQNK